MTHIVHAGKGSERDRVKGRIRGGTRRGFCWVARYQATLQTTLILTSRGEAIVGPGTMDIVLFERPTKRRSSHARCACGIQRTGYRQLR